MKLVLPLLTLLPKQVVIVVMLITAAKVLVVLFMTLASTATWAKVAAASHPLHLLCGQAAPWLELKEQQLRPVLKLTLPRTPKNSDIRVRRVRNTAVAACSGFSQIVIAFCNCRGSYVLQNTCNS